MGFLDRFKDRIFKGEQDDEDYELLDWARDAEADAEPEEQEGEAEPEAEEEEEQGIDQLNVGTLQVSTMKLAAESDAKAEESDDDPDDDSEASAEEDSGDEEQDESPGNSLLDIFEEEAPENQQLAGLAAWVENVEAEELAEDLRALMGDLQRL